MPEPGHLRAALAVEQERRRRDRVAEAATFTGWLPKAIPTADDGRPTRWDWRHLQLIAQHLERVERGEIRRLLIEAPPRHCKSSTATVAFPAWFLERNPHRRVILGCHNSDLAVSFSRAVRRILAPRIELSEEANRADAWETREGGGLRAAGVGTGVTGRGAHLVVVDDPVRGRGEAESRPERESVSDWFRSELLTRLEPGAAVVLCMARWHTDDLAGRCLAGATGSEWTVLRLPALAEEGDVLGRAEGEPLCPERYDRAALEERRAEIGEHDFNALYQARPAAREGALFLVDKIGVLESMPDDITAECRAWDLAWTASSRADFSAGVRLARRACGRWLVIDVQRGRWEPAERDRSMLGTARTDGTTVRVRLPQDPSAGKGAALALTAMLAGFSVAAEPVHGNKVSRADPVISQVNAGMLDVIRAPWNREFIEELRTFPSGRNDDQVDALADAFTELAARGIKAAGAPPPPRPPSRWTRGGWGLRPGRFGARMFDGLG